MPLIAAHRLPSHDRLRAEGFDVRADAGGARVLRVGLLNMMADAALEATERQLLRLLARGAPDAAVSLHPFTLPEIARGAAGAAHVRRYPSFAEVRDAGLDALFVTGANVPHPDLNRLPFRDPMLAALDWARDAVPSTLYSCLATHAVLGFRHDEPRRRLERKCWGVFPHRVDTPDHPLVAGLSARPVVPHSRWNDVSREQFERAGLTVLMSCETDGGVHAAVGGDGWREIFWQGHPEYDPESLLKEYKREVGRFAAGELDGHPECPQGIVDGEGADIVDAHRAAVERAVAAAAPPPPFPEAELAPRLGHAWHDDTATMVGNWIALVEAHLSGTGA